jgi:hypothetical protein
MCATAFCFAYVNSAILITFNFLRQMLSDVFATTLLVLDPSRSGVVRWHPQSVFPPAAHLRLCYADLFSAHELRKEVGNLHIVKPIEHLHSLVQIAQAPLLMFLSCNALSIEPYLDLTRCTSSQARFTSKCLRQKVVFTRAGSKEICSH